MKLATLRERAVDAFPSLSDVSRRRGAGPHVSIERIDIPRLVIAGTHSGVGKTTVATALMAALERRGVCGVTGTVLSAEVFSPVTCICVSPRFQSSRAFAEGCGKRHS